ncbi:ketopantoate reductase family protein [Paenirhodobacter populi]|uniref:ketopantoate reductase family protein n=1 Tax=Paenirhodobacter populi TaxID=2306993 RepID=UPI000FE3DEBB|nr:2-dehydropantoate 2-reductase N-terminal domain-containing protein [Sinirhodobacter populi]RWR09099.1 ketopantoate reductase family protein [Sinirhodobacter populi]
MRYIIIGAGAVGASLAAEFELAGIEYLLVGRGTQLSHLQQHGLSFRRPSGTRIVPLKLTDQAGLRLRHGDVLVLTVKTQDAEETSAALAVLPLEGGGLGADLPIVTLQNGLATERIAARRFANVYGASILVPAIYTETGRVKVLSGPQLALVTVGRFPSGRDAVSAQIVADLTRANSLAEEREDIQRWKAAKLLRNVKNVLELFASAPEDLEQAGRAMVAEAEQALRAAGYDPARNEERRVSIAEWKVLRDEEEPTGQSTWQSFVRGARSEVDFLNGEIVLLGRLHGVATPWNHAAQRLAAELAARGGAPGEIELSTLIAQARADEANGEATGAGAATRATE